MLWLGLALLAVVVLILVIKMTTKKTDNMLENDEYHPIEQTEEKTFVSNNDDNMANDISHIFIEEAQEIFAELDSLLALWLADLDNKTLQTDIRRQFFSLKGGARLTGAKACADVADSIEQVLNTLLDNPNIKVDPSLFKCVTEGKAIMATLVADFEQQNKPSVDYKNFIMKTKELGLY